MKLNKLALTLEEYEQLNKKHKTLSNAGDIMTQSKLLIGLLRDDDFNIIHTLHLSLQKLNELRKLTSLTQQLKDQLENLSDRDQALEQLIKQRTTIQQNYFNAATQLHESRVKTAKKLGKMISKHIQELGMPGGELSRISLAIQMIATH